jgi:phosphoribosyl 1,2-cyclic phosphodiesterase
MLHLTLLASGSSGNCSIVETPKSRLLVDGGVSAKQIVLRLRAAGFTPLEMDGVLITHEHIDHVQGLAVFLKSFPLPVYCNRLTAETLRSSSLAQHRDWRIFETGAGFSIKDLDVQTFSVPHDAVDPIGFVARNGRGALGFLTDLGYATKLALERVREATTLVIETNHDEKLLADDTRRPWSVKQRILSRHGHLSNIAAAEVVAALGAALPRRVILGHLSRHCNTPELALEAMATRLRDIEAPSPELFCASPVEISPRFAIGE